MTQRRRPTIGLLLIGLVMAACGGTATPAPASGPAGSGPAGSGAPVKGGTVNLSMFEDPDTLDPTFAGTAGAREVFINMCERMYDLDAQGNLVPQLASALPKVSADGLTVTIDVRTGAKFNDGTPMDVASVVTSLERHRSAEGSRRKSELANVAKIEASGTSAIVLTMSKPDSSLAATLSDRAGMIMSPAQITKLGKDFGTSPVCVGPFKFVERVAGDHITLARSTDYYDAEHVYLEKIVYKPIADETVRTANLRSGDLQVVDRVATTDVAALKGDAKYVSLKVTSNAYGALTVNVANANGLAGAPGTIKSPLANPKLREAFDLALDRDQINTIVYSGLQQVGCGPISPANVFYDGIPCPARDLAGAKRLVAESGVATPIPVELQVPNSPANVRLGELIQSQVAEAGFAVKVVALENVTSFNNQTAGKFEVMLTPWSGRVDPDANIYRFHYSTGSDNTPKAVDPALDALLDKARAESNFDARKALYKQIVEQVRARRSVIYFQQQVLYAAYTAALHGFAMYVDGMPRLKSAYLGGA